MCIKRQVRGSGTGSGGTLLFGPDRSVTRVQLEQMLARAGGDLSLIHISEPTRRTPLYSSAASDVYKETGARERDRIRRHPTVRTRPLGDPRATGADARSSGRRPVSYTHLRAHETDTSLFVGSVRCV